MAARCPRFAVNRPDCIASISKMAQLTLYLASICRLIICPQLIYAECVKLFEELIRPSVSVLPSSLDPSKNGEFDQAVRTGTGDECFFDLNGA